MGFALACTWVSLVILHNCFGLPRAHLASLPSEAKAERSELHPGEIWFGFGAEIEEKRQAQVAEALHSSQLERSRVSPSNTDNCEHYELALQDMSGPEWAKIRKMSFMRPPLVTVLGSSQEAPKIKVEKQRQESAEGTCLERQAVRSGSSSGRPDGYVSNSSSLDTIDSTRKIATDETNGAARCWSYRHGVAAATHPSSASSGHQHSEVSTEMTAEETKALEHLRAVVAMGLPRTPEFDRQLQELEQKEKEAASVRCLTHGHINRLNRLKSQVSAAAKKISVADVEWKNFVTRTQSKIRYRADMYRQHRGQLWDAYQGKLMELDNYKKEVSAASMSLMDAHNHGVLQVSRESPQEQQCQELMAALQGATVDLTNPVVPGEDTMPMVTEILESDEEAELVKEDPKPVRRVRQQQHHHPRSPTGVSQQHLKVKGEKAEKDGKDGKET